MKSDHPGNAAVSSPTTRIALPPIGRADEGGPFETYLEWQSYRWVRCVESYVEIDYGEPRMMNNVTPNVEHLGVLLTSFNVPSWIVPLDSIRETSPAHLTQLAAACSDLGGEDTLRGFLKALSAEGFSVQAYAGGGAWGHVFRTRKEDQPSRSRC